MKKRLFALCMALVIVMLSVTAALADSDSFSLDYFKELSDLFEITVQSDNGIAFVDCDEGISVKNRSFTHKYEHPTKYSYIYSDLVIIDYFKSNPYPIARLWIEYSGTQGIYATSVSFLIDGKKYTFSEVSDSDRITTDENGVEETLLIKLSFDNFDFLTAMINWIDDKRSTEDWDAAIPVILHGTEDLQIEMNSWAWLDFYAILNGMYMSNGLATGFNKTDGTPLKVTDITN